jgi:hypothetical protein
MGDFLLSARLELYAWGPNIESFHMGAQHASPYLSLSRLPLPPAQGLHRFHLILSLLFYKNEWRTGVEGKHRSHNKHNKNEPKIGVIRHTQGRPKKPQSDAHQN